MRTVVLLSASSGALLVFLGFTAPPPKASRGWALLDRLGRDAGRPSWRARHVAGCCFATALAAVTLASTLTSSAVVVVSSLFTGGWAPVAWLRGRARKRRLSHRDVWPEAIALLTSGVRAGLSLPEVVAAMSDRGPEVLRPYFHAFRATYRSSTSFPTALEALRDDLADPIADRVVSALKLAHEIGGTDLVRVLRTLGDFVRDDLRVRKEIEARWSWTVTAARLAAAAPWLVLVTMSSRPEAAAAYDSAAGLVLVAAGAGATFLGYRLMLRAARLPEQSRWSS